MTQTGRPIIDNSPITYLGEVSDRARAAIEKAFKELEDKGISQIGRAHV